jgi:hypothetical protein
MNVAIFWDIAPCELRFKGTDHLHLHGRKLFEEERYVQHVDCSQEDDTCCIPADCNILL